MPATGKVGYSLVEILVALTLFSLAALGLSAGVGTAIRAGQRSADFTLATILAQDKLEELFAQGTLVSDGSDAPQPRFTRVWVVTPDAPEIGVAQIDVTVSWADSAEHTVTLTTVLNE
ncbi:MAG: prepilin-type N-terminal cleavage/methylation domain-containing protein [Thermodesulfobacteriota bacterium]|jgi:prepilin-type N-terminal cleavage/methylation domain-containing protein